MVSEQIQLITGAWEHDALAGGGTEEGQGAQALFRALTLRLFLLVMLQRVSEAAEE